MWHTAPQPRVLLQVGAQTETELKEKKLRVEDALNATKVCPEAVPQHRPALLSVDSLAPHRAVIYKPINSYAMPHLCAPFGHEPLWWQPESYLLLLSDARCHQICALDYPWSSDAAAVWPCALSAAAVEPVAMPM